MSLKNKDTKLLERLENISYFDLDEFLALDIYDLENALNSKNKEIKRKAKTILENFKDCLKEDKVFNTILYYTKNETPFVYKLIKEL